MTPMPRIVAALAALALSGCSLITMERLPSGYRPETTPRCGTGSGAPPVLDVLWAGMIGALYTDVALEWSEDPPVDDVERNDRISLSGFYAAVIASFLGSSYYGLRQYRRCAGARRAHRAWLEETRTRRDGSAPGAAGGTP